MKTIIYEKHDVTEAFPYQNAKFDVVHSSELIEHVKDTMFFLKECKRVLKPGGRMIISTPNLHYWRNIIEWFNGNQFFLLTIMTHKRAIYDIFALKRYMN